jgi:hypothetical protein
MLRELLIQTVVLSVTDLVCTPGDDSSVPRDISSNALAVDVRSVLNALCPGVAFEFPSEVPPPGLLIPVGLAHRRTTSQYELREVVRRSPPIARN